MKHRKSRIMYRPLFVLMIVLSIGLSSSAQTSSARSVPTFGPLPTARQMAWEDKEFYLFTHFGPNTFTDLEWGKGTEKEEVFNPTQLDCRQWCRIAKAAGAKGIIITAKHHDGFCLWPSQYSTHTVAQSRWRDGKGDVLKELATACRESGLEIGIYLSPWDRNHPKYGTSEYNQVFIHMIKEVVTRYGPLFEFWWDGANGEGPNGKIQHYTFGKFEQTIRSIAPNTSIFSDIGPDIRWVGNEDGIAGTTNWNLLDTAGFSRGEGGPPTDTLNRGNEAGKLWLSAECDVSIRPGWFYHQDQDTAVKTPEQLFRLYLQSVGRGANMLLNVPPDRRGLFTGFDSAALIGFKKLRDESFRTNLLRQKGTRIDVGASVDAGRSPDAGKATGVINAQNTANLMDGDNRSFISLGSDYTKKEINFTFVNPVQVNCLVLQEPIQMGQRVGSYLIRVKRPDGTVFEVTGTTIGHKRIITFPSQMAGSLSIRVTDAKAAPLISETGVFCIPENLVETPYGTGQPALLKNNGQTQLIVDGKPFISVAGELHNSSSSGEAYFSKALDYAKSLNINTVIASVSWEQFEPQEGQFDYTLLDHIMARARQENLKLVLIWFASWKNGESAYVPMWVKADAKRFWRVKTKNGIDIHTISPFCKAAMEADAKAFSRLMQRIGEKDSRHNVIMVQVENEVGAFSEMDYNDEALKGYNDVVPPAWWNYLSNHKDPLDPELQDAWVRNGRKTGGNWAAVFGEDNDDAHNFFMSWQYATYINTVCEAGKKAYDIPMFVNCWIVQHPGEKPGAYPNGGPVSRVMDIYKAAAPAVDFCSPDIYLKNFKEVCQMYYRPAKGNPLFIPECDDDNPGKAFYAIGECNAIGFSPFGIESDAADRSYAQSFAMLRELLPQVQEYQGSGKMRGVLKQGDESKDTLRMGKYEIEVRYKGKDQNCYGIIIQTGEDEFLVSGTHLQLKFRSIDKAHVAEVGQVLEGTFKGDNWETIRVLNGDESGSDYTANIPGRHYYTTIGKERFTAEPAWVHIPGLEQVTEGGVAKQLVEAPGIYKVSVITY